MQVAVVVVEIIPQAQEVQAAAGQEIQVLVLALVELLTPEAAAAAVVGVRAMVAQVVQGLSLFLTQAHNEAQAAQSHQAVATPFTHSQLQAHITLNF